MDIQDIGKAKTMTTIETTFLESENKNEQIFKSENNNSNIFKLFKSRE